MNNVRNMWRFIYTSWHVLLPFLIYLEALRSGFFAAHCSHARSPAPSHCRIPCTDEFSTGEEISLQTTTSHFVRFGSVCFTPVIITEHYLSLSLSFILAVSVRLLYLTLFSLLIIIVTVIALL